MKQKSKNKKMTPDFKLSDLIINGKDCIESESAPAQLFAIESIKEFLRRLKEEIKQGVERNGVLPLDWCFDRIDTLSGFQDEEQE